MQNPNRSVKTKSKIQNPKSEIQNPKSKIQNPKSKIQDPKSKIQNPNGRIWGCHIKNGYYDNPKSKIQNPKSKIQNPRSKIQDPKSKIQDPESKIQNPKSKIQNPRSKIQNPKSKIQDPKSKIQNPKSKIQNAKSKIQNPNSKIQNPNGPFGFWILEFGFGWPGWGGYVANALVWMGWPPKCGVVGWTQACKQKVGGPIPPVPGSNWAPISRFYRFPALWWRAVVCPATILWVQLRERGQEKEIKKMPQPFVAMLVDNRVELWMFLVSWVLLREGWWTKKDVKNFCRGKIWCRCNHMRGYTHRSLRLHHLLRCMGSGSAADRR